MIAKTPLRDLCTWQEHYDELVNPTLMTGLLHKAIPVLEHCQWRVSKVSEGHCETVLPLNEASTNQHGTHQAALISLSADYTGGLALATLLRGIPLAGIHRCKDEESASLWLAGMNVKYKAPSSGHLIGICRINSETADKIVKRYERGSRVLVSLEIEFYSNGEQVATAEMKYFAQPSTQLIPTVERPARSTLFQHKLKASARMIAGLRAQTSDRSRLNPCCPYAAQAAGEHGLLLADKLQQRLPQLRDMVLARTQHIDECLDAPENLRQVVMVGAGLDLRSIRHAKLRRDVNFFEVDLPEMLEERSRVTKAVDHRFDNRRFMIDADFKSENLADKIGQHPFFSEQACTFIVFEGCSMYFSEDENRRILRELRSLMRHPDSRLWLDIVSESVSNRVTSNERILSFLDGMDDLGEEFVFGKDTPGKWLQSVGFSDVKTVSCADYLGDSDAVLDSYAFSLAKA